LKFFQATAGDVITAYASLVPWVMTQKLEIAYRSPVPLKSVLKFSVCCFLFLSFGFFSKQNNNKKGRKTTFCRAAQRHCVCCCRVFRRAKSNQICCSRRVCETENQSSKNVNVNEIDFIQGRETTENLR
jgi:hypothetical protein